MLKINYKLKDNLRDKRKSQRLNIPLQVKYKLVPQTNILEETIAKNISGGGIGIRLGKPLHKGKRFKILIYFPGDTKPVTAISEVVWCRKALNKKRVYYNIGIRHVKIIPADRQRFVFLFCEMMINYFISGRLK